MGVARKGLSQHREITQLLRTPLRQKPSCDTCHSTMSAWSICCLQEPSLKKYPFCMQMRYLKQFWVVGRKSTCCKRVFPEEFFSVVAMFSKEPFDKDLIIFLDKSQANQNKLESSARDILYSMKNIMISKLEQTCIHLV